MHVLYWVCIGIIKFARVFLSLHVFYGVCAMCYNVRIRIINSTSQLLILRVIINHPINYYKVCMILINLVRVVRLVRVGCPWVISFANSNAQTLFVCDGSFAYFRLHDQRLNWASKRRELSLIAANKGNIFLLYNIVGKNYFVAICCLICSKIKKKLVLYFKY